MQEAKKTFVPATRLHMEPLPDKTQTAINHLKSLGYKVIAPPAEAEKKLRAA